MAAIRHRNTKPEMVVRRLLHAAGFRFRLHRKDLPGTPDIVLPKYRAVILVNGCFWHGHSCSKGTRPATNTEFWNDKLDKNLERDATKKEKLQELGWHVIIVWECELKQ